MCIFSASPPTVNSRGDVLSDRDINALSGDVMANPLVKFTGMDIADVYGPKSERLKLTPQQRGEMLFNWLTAGGKPKPVEPGKTFKDKQDISGVEAKASAGQGINSLFGFGKFIGDLGPKKLEPVEVATPALSGIKMIEPLKPMNQSPMQPGVPYAALPLPGVK